MKKIVIALVILSFTLPAFAEPTAQPHKRKDYTKRSWINKVTDSVSTMGKTPREKKRIIQRRTEDRSYIRKRNDENKKDAQTQRRIAQEQQNILNGIPQGKTSVGL